jgi:S-DNA-T family DNA segregation ATPase FtsK/SpoIIIE
VGNHRNALVAVVRQELAEARGTARAILAAAETARSAAQSRRRLVRDAYAACLNQLAEAREAARSDILRRFQAEAVALSGHATSVAALCASGAAGASWRMWAPTEPERAGRPGLLRIGTISYESKTLPALVPLLDAVHLQLSGDQAGVDGAIAGLLLRALGTTRPGEIRLTVYDPENLGGSLAAFAPLGLSFVGPGGLSALLDDLVEHICRVNETVLAGEYASLAALTRARTGPRAEPWRVVVLLADAASVAELTNSQRAQLDRIVRTGVACGVHLVVRGLDLGKHPTVERIAVRDQLATCETTGDLTVRLDPAPPADRIAAFCRSVAERLREGPPPALFTALEPAKLWTESSEHGLHAPIGDSTDGSLVEVPLGDDPPHALIGGPSGSGKTNLIYAWLGSLTARYGPEELALYLLDFKEGVSFARFTPGPRDPSWLPQVRLAGINVNGDREFGLAMLRHLGEQLRARAQAAKRYEASKLAELRAEDPGGHWPRIVAVIDEFQVLLAGRDAVADEAVTLLEDLARRGRSQGIHLVLASQDVSGIEALWGPVHVADRAAQGAPHPGRRQPGRRGHPPIPRGGQRRLRRGRGEPDRPPARRERPDRLAQTAAPALARAPGQLHRAPAVRRRRGASAARPVPAGRAGAGRLGGGRLVARCGARRADRRDGATGPVAAGADARAQPGGAGYPYR